MNLSPSTSGNITFSLSPLSFQPFVVRPEAQLPPIEHQDLDLSMMDDFTTLGADSVPSPAEKPIGNSVKEIFAFLGKGVLDASPKGEDDLTEALRSLLLVRPVPEKDARASSCFRSTMAGGTPSASCEWGKARRVLMHQPGPEVEQGLYHARAALFEKFFDVFEAIEEHQKYVERLRAYGSAVTTVVDVLLEGTQEKNSAALEDLRRFALGSLSYEYDEDFSEEEKAVEEKYRVTTVMQMAPRQLLNMIMTRPTLHLHKEAINTHLSATRTVSPVMDLYFLRDQMITTAKGVVVARMNSPQRFPEVDIIRFVLKKMGIKPLYEVEGAGTLEGGDFLPAGRVAFIGQGMRTNADAIRQLMDHDVFGNIEFLAVVKDSYMNQDQMHLDTYFNIIGPHQAVIVETRMHDKGVSPVLATTVDLYARSERGAFTLVRKEVDFVEYLREDLGFELISVSNDDQLKYGVNFLTVESGKLFGIDGVSQEYKDRLQSRGVDVTWMDFNALTSGYGAAHCTTQVLSRLSWQTP